MRLLYELTDRVDLDLHWNKIIVCCKLLINFPNSNENILKSAIILECEVWLWYIVWAMWCSISNHIYTAPRREKNVRS